MTEQPYDIPQPATPAPQPFYDEATGQWWLPAQPNPQPQSLQAAGVPLTIPGKQRRRPSKNRVIAGILLAAMLGALFWVVFATDLLTPVMAYAQPVTDFVEWAKEDPTRLIGTGATFALTYIGTYTLLFGDPR